MAQLIDIYGVWNRHVLMLAITENILHNKQKQHL